MWIKVEDSLPKAYESVLVKLKDGTVTGAFYNDYEGFQPVSIKLHFNGDWLEFSSKVVKWTSLINIGE